VSALSEETRAHFPEIEEGQWARLAAYADLLRGWNARVNLVSRKEPELIETRHIAPCLVPVKFLSLAEGGHPARFLDAGTGGGLPGLVLAILYPRAQFLLVDSIAKKVRAVEDIAARLGLDNVAVRQARAEGLDGQFDFVTGRAVTALPDFIGWVRKRLRPGNRHSIANGLLYWKGGEIEPALREQGIKPVQTYPIDEYTGDAFFAGKYIAHFEARTVKGFKQELTK